MKSLEKLDAWRYAIADKIIALSTADNSSKTRLK
jgi:hypothetical protein